MSRQASGLKAWVVQRASAVYLALFIAYLLLYFTLAPPADHAALAAWASRPWVSAAFLLFIPLLLAHAWIGIRDVLIDYVHPIGARVILLGLFALMLLGSGLWAMKALIVAGMSL
jgi:succinate dehydrogenase / fumarate reductase membrane anchor subunit